MPTLGMESVSVVPMELFTISKKMNRTQKLELGLIVLGVAFIIFVVLWPDWGYILARFGVRGRSPLLYNSMTKEF